jgi:AcrR family transcriptional regulator
VTAPETRNRSRRTTRPSGDDRELAILNTLEQLLDLRPFGEISVDELAKGAGLSRPTFYFYFGSKDAVLLKLFEQVLAAADATLAEPSEQIPEDDPIDGWRDGIYAFFDALRPHRGVVLAGLAATVTHPEIRAVWSAFMATWIDHTAGLITAERARGAAPKTIPAHDLATALNLMNERVMFASQGAEQPMLSEDVALETLAHIWITSIYGRPATVDGPSTHS